MEENKYIQYINNNPDDEARKKARRHRRAVARLWAFIAVFAVIALAGFGAFMLINAYNSGKINLDLPGGSKTSVVSVDENTSVKNTLDDLIGEEEEVVVVTPTNPDPEPTPEDLFDEKLTEMIASMPLEEKVMGLFIVRPEQITGVEAVVQAGEGTKEALARYPVGGIVYGDKNITDDVKFSQMLKSTREYSKYPIFLILSDGNGNEGLTSKLGSDIYFEQGAIGESKDPYVAYTKGLDNARALQKCGLDFAIAPVADVLGNDESLAETYFMKDRSFGTDPSLVSRMVLESVNAYKECGITPALCYFPGQGTLTQSPMDYVTTTLITPEEVKAYYYDTYKTAIDNGAGAIVVSHEYADNLTTDNMPCSLSKDIYTGMLREQFSFYDTVLITDRLDATVISEYYTSSEACVKAIKAGADMVMCPEDFEEGYTAVIEAVRSNVISEERINDSLKRVYKIKYADMMKEFSSAELSNGD